MSKNYYAILGVARADGAEDIKRAYRKLASIWHPDRNDSPEAKAKFQEIQEAYDVLSDDAKRAEYDTTGTVKNSAGDNDALNFIRGKLMEIMEAPNVNIANIDIVREVKNSLLQERNRAVAFLADVEKRITKYTSAVSRMKSKRGENFLAAMLQDELNKAGKMKEATESATRVLDRATEIVNDHEFDFTPMLRGASFHSHQQDAFAQVLSLYQQPPEND